MQSNEKNLLNTNQMQFIAAQVLAEAKRAGADQAEVNIDATKGFSVTAVKGEVETVEYNLDKSIGITVFFGKRSGMASMTDVSSQAIRAAVEAACHIAKFTDEDPAAGLAEKSELAFDYPQLALAFPWRISVEEAIKLAVQCEQTALAYDKRIMLAEESKVSTTEAMTLYANSEGFLGVYPLTHHEISCVVVAKEKEEMQRDYSYTLSSDPAALSSVERIALDAAMRAVHRLGARTIPTTKAPVIFVAEEARSLLRHFASAIHGSNIDRKSSFLLDKLGKRIFPSHIQIKEYPHLARGYGSAPFDHDGVATRENVFVEDGVLRQWSLGVYTARKLGLKTTGNSGGVHNLTIAPGTKTLDTLLKTMDRGLLITELMGQGVNLITGDYSRGAAGFWVEGGEIQYPVHEITVAGNLHTIFENFAEVGSDVDERGNIRTGSLLINEMMIAGG